MTGTRSSTPGPDWWLWWRDRLHSQRRRRQASIYFQRGWVCCRRPAEGYVPATHGCLVLHGPDHYPAGETTYNYTEKLVWELGEPSGDDYAQELFVFPRDEDHIPDWFREGLKDATWTPPAKKPFRSSFWKRNPQTPRQQKQVQAARNQERTNPTTLTLQNIVDDGALLFLETYHFQDDQFEEWATSAGIRRMPLPA